MASPSVTYTFVNGTAADGTQVNQNFTDILNGITDGTKTITVSAVVTTSLTVSGVSLFAAGASTAPSIAFSVEATLGFARAGTTSVALYGNSSGTLALSIYNQEASSGNSALQIITSAGSSGDAYIFFEESGVSASYWALGRDDSASGSFKISQNSSLGTNDFFAITALGVVSFGPNLEVASDGSTFILSRSRDGLPMRFLASNGSNTAQSSAYVGTLVAGSSGGDAYFRCSMADSVFWSFGLANGNSDRFEICNASSVGSSAMFIVSTLGSVIIGSASVATNATDGFLYIPSCTGTPTGTPTSFSPKLPIVYDSTNNKLYVYNSGWKGVTLS